MNIYYHKKIGLDIFGFWRKVGRLVIAFGMAICMGKLLWELTKPPISWLSILLYIFYYTVLVAGSLFLVALKKEQRKEWIEFFRKGGAKLWRPKS